MENLTLNPGKTALILIDLQRGIVSRDVAPHSSDKVVENARKLIEKCREKGIMIVLVRVSFSNDAKDRLSPKTDISSQVRTMSADFDVLVPQLEPDKADLIITKHQWGAFYGTELDLQLRRRNIDTIILGGISTNIGVESTARDAYERGYNQVFVEDATSCLTAEAHEFTVSNIFPRMGRVRVTDDVLNSI